MKKIFMAIALCLMCAVSFTSCNILYGFVDSEPNIIHHNDTTIYFYKKCIRTSPINSVEYMEIPKEGLTKMFKLEDGKLVNAKIFEMPIQTQNDFFNYEKELIGKQVTYIDSVFQSKHIKGHTDTTYFTNLHITYSRYYDENYKYVIISDGHKDASFVINNSYFYKLYISDSNKYITYYDYLKYGDKFKSANTNKTLIDIISWIDE